MSRLGNHYEKVYSLICGKHPRLRPWHFQWLVVKDLYADLRRVLPQLSGKVLDVGCGDKPYKTWLSRAVLCVGLDVAGGFGVDVIAEPGKPWPIDSASFDAVLCTQVLEHVSDLEATLVEIGRVLKPGGLLVVTIPFMYNEHGAPEDYRRLSTHGTRRMFVRCYEIIELKTQGGIGSTIGILCLNWVEAEMNRSKATRILKGCLLPPWVVFCAFVNGLGWLMDKLDRTQAFYSNVLLVSKKRCD